ncbi:hypothetical protein AMATHDRAFT_141443 [Amanita thiersii Skay4041]|uniref:Actin interacting protein 3 C-terminal domain-containing protein n=1 Tax=Amanita thiersii Skay4041 TaxID=703135 RepID=A0A2A9NUD9_9AGAR|nr:hypothetical protein AMATHDRAFT_141443 [Amanita thiersii Skay4041]
MSQTAAHRRDNHSVSSRGDRAARHHSNPAVESAVTRLLVSIKNLLESLTQWSQLKIDENRVSDVYVCLGNDFNAAVAAFGAYNIDMSELMSVPDDLRTVLEQCLAEDATPENLDNYLPSVRQIITNLLQGLRGKQSIYRRIVSDSRHRSSAENGHDKGDRASRGERDRTSRRGEMAHRSRGPEGDRDRDVPSRRSTAQSSLSSSTSGRRREEEHHFIGGFAPSITEHAQAQQQQYSVPPPVEHPSPPVLTPPPIEPLPLDGGPSSGSTMNDEMTPKAPQAQPKEAVPAHVKRFPLFDKPMPPSSPPVVVDPPVVVEPSSSEEINRNRTGTPPPDSAIPVDQSPVVANSLAALKNTEVQRRASKRFSTFNISKITGGSHRERSIRNHPNRKSLAVSSALTPGELAVLTEVDDEDREGAVSTKEARPAISRTPTPDTRPPVPSLPATPARTPEPSAPPIEVNGMQSQDAMAPSKGLGETSKITVFLQLGREVKKVIVERGISFSSLRVLFVDKFSYNPGLENFPAIYIRDPSSGVQYELEDTDEVRDKCLLSLNIEPLDQIKQHIDSQISSLSQDIKELKTVVSNNSRQLQPIIAQPLADNVPETSRPTDKQFQTVARRISRFIGNASPNPAVGPPMSPSPSLSGISIMSQSTGSGLQPQMTGASVLSDYSIRIVSDLKTQFDEVQNLRRDIGVMRQLYTEFMKQTKDSLGTLRTQTQSVRQLATTSVGGARAYIDSGKQKLDSRSQNLLTEVEKLQDAVENIKDDVIKRHVTPKAQYIKTIKKDMDSIGKELDSLKEHIKTIKPMWKKTWEEELQNIVEEQQFLTHQEEFLSDLLDDHKAVGEIYGHVEKVITLRLSGTNGASRNLRSRNFRSLPAEEGGQGGLSKVMWELRGAAAVDPERRLKAIEINQKNREKELASQSDELHSELTDFVGQKKLRKTGGAEETERVRQKRNEMTLKAMFNSTGSSPGHGVSEPLQQ